MQHRRSRPVRYGVSAALIAALALGAAAAPTQTSAQTPVKEPAPKASPKSSLMTAPTPQEWADLAKLRDWSGVWNPRIADQDAQIRTNMPPWTPKAAAQIQHMMAEERAGRPPPLFVECLPEA